MTIIIHRGTHQIGGCATEIRTDTTRILIDFGSELTSSEEKDPQNLQIKGLTYGKPDFDAVFFTHYHGDHIGMLECIPADIPVYMGETACEIFSLYAKRVGEGVQASRLRSVTALKPVQVGDITVTPIPADHSAYDALMYLIEADGKRILHTGDFRLHGFRGKATIPLIRHFAPEIDVLIIEGTRISGGRHSGASEKELQNQLRQLLAEHKYVFALCSSTNIDRLASLHNATPKGRYFVCDKYQKDIFDVVVAHSDSRWYQFQKALTLGGNLQLQDRGFVMPVRVSGTFSELVKGYPEAVLIYSMWEGYLDGRSPAISAFAKPFKESGRFYSLHSSGHASGPDLLKLCCAVSPRIGVIPIHTEDGSGFRTLKGIRLIELQDNEEFQL